MPRIVLNFRKRENDNQYKRRRNDEKKKFLKRKFPNFQKQQTNKKRIEFRI